MGRLTAIAPAAVALASGGCGAEEAAREAVDPIAEAAARTGEMRLNFDDFGPGHDVALPDEGDVNDVSDEWEKYKVHFTG